MNKEFEPQNGGCTCGQVRFQMKVTPLIVHACHCRWCQKQTGAPHVINALVESELLDHTDGKIENVQVPTPSGMGQTIARCNSCKVALWSHYDFGGLGEHVCFVRVGALDHPDSFPPDVHIYTSSKMPWYLIHPSHKSVDEFYDLRKTWRPDSLRRLQAIQVAAADRETQNCD